MIKNVGSPISYIDIKLDNLGEKVKANNYGIPASKKPEIMKQKKSNQMLKKDADKNSASALH